jgi:hypothetical protein
MADAGDGGIIDSQREGFRVSGRRRVSNILCLMADSTGVRREAAGACWRVSINDEQINNLDGFKNHGSGQKTAGKEGVA